MKQFSAAQKAYYFATGNYAAFSEGTSPTNGYLYEWIVARNGNTWQIMNATPFYFDKMNPIIFSKAAYGLLSLHNITYALSMVIALERALPLTQQTVTMTAWILLELKTPETLEASCPLLCPEQS